MAFQPANSFTAVASAKDVIVYTRISTAKNANSTSNSQYDIQPVSLETQYITCKEYCDSKNYNIILNVSDISSAYTKTPPNLRKLISKSNKGRHIIIYAIDRFSRNTDIGFQLLKDAEKHNITIEFVSDGFNTSNERHILQIKGAILQAEHESRIIGSRIKARNAVKRSMGWKFGNAKYGYKIVFRNGVRQQIANPQEQKVIRFIKYISADFNLDKLNKYLRDITDFTEDIVMYDSTGNEIHCNEYYAQPAREVANLLNSYSIYDRNEKPWTAMKIRRVIKQNTISVNDLMEVSKLSISK